MFDYILEKIKDTKTDFGEILDLGGHDGIKVAKFFESNVTLVDKNRKVLNKAYSMFPNMKVVESDVRDFIYNNKYDVILLSNVLPFLSSDDIVKVATKAWSNLNTGGFIYFTLFGKHNDGLKEKMRTIVSKKFSLSVIKDKPFIFIEERAPSKSMQGDMRKWHIYHLVYKK